jgi:hypothetical protein
MVLELSPQQLDLLHACLSQSIEELHDEVLHTDRHELRSALRRQLVQLRDLRRRVAVHLAHEAPQHTAG